MSLVPFLLATALAAAPGPDATAQAKKVFAEGQKLYTQGKYQPALARFEEAYALKPLPLLRYNAARCHERLGAPAPALRAYRDFLRLSPKAPEREAVTKAMVELQKQLHERGVQQLLVLTEPPAAEVEVDGKPLGPAPASIELPGGEHQVTARLPGYAVATRRIVVNTATMVDLSITLEAALAPPPPPPAVTDAPKEPVLTPAATVVVAPVAVEPAPKARVFTWVAGGVGVAALGAAVGMGVAASSSSQRLRDGTVRPQQEAQALYDSARGLNTGANVSYGVAGAALVTAAILFFVEGR